MGPKQPRAQSLDLFRQPLSEMLKPDHQLIKLANVIDWEGIENILASHFQSTTGRPALSPRLVAGLLYLQHAHDCSDEVIVNTWLDNPYVQYFCGELYFQTHFPMDPASLTRWRKRIGKEGVETLLIATIDAALKIYMMKASSADRVIVNTTVMPKNVAYPTDSQLPERSRQHMVRFANENNMTLRQNYNREAPRLAIKIGRYAHAKQYKRKQSSLKMLKTRVGREMNRKLDQALEKARAEAEAVLHKTQRILTQKVKDKNKIYAFHAPEIVCISKGKARARYEFGVKVTVATTLKEGLS